MNCSTGTTTAMVYSPLMAVSPLFLQGQTLTIARQTLGLEGEAAADSSATSHLGTSGGFSFVGGGMGGGMGGVGLGAMNQWMRGAMNFSKAYGYALDPATRPKSIDLVSASGMALLGIYDLSGERMEICIGLQRPKGLAMEREGKSVQIVLRRVTGARAAKPADCVTRGGSGLALGKAKPLRPLVIDVDRDGTAMISGMPIKDDGLQTLVGLLVRENPRRRVRLRCDADLPFSRVADLLAVMKTAGMPRSSVLLATAPIPAARLDFRIAPVAQVAKMPATMPGKEGENIPSSKQRSSATWRTFRRHGPTYGRAARDRPVQCPAKCPCGLDRAAGRDREGKRHFDPPPASGGADSPAVSVRVAIQTPPGPVNEDLMQTIRELVAAVLPGIEADGVKIVGADGGGHITELAKGVEDAPRDPAAGESYTWFELAAEAPSPLITGTYEGRKQVLLSVRPEESMAADDEGSLRWRIADVALGKTDQGRPTLRVTLDDAAHGAWRP